MTDMQTAEAANAAGPAKRAVMITNQRGLHARASAKFVNTAQGFDADIRVRRGGEVVDGASIMDLLMLAAGPGTQIEIEASGRDAAAAVAALADLVERKFDEGV